MPSRVLVAYTTRGGSTGEVAEAIGSALRESGLKADVSRMRNIRSIGEYDAVILGAPLYIGGVPGECRRFLSRKRSDLAALRTWFFVLGPTEAKPEQFTFARQQAEKILANYSWFKPVELQVFGGRLDPNRLKFPFSLLRAMPAFRKIAAMSKDIRDWEVIGRWATEIARRLVPAA